MGSAGRRSLALAVAAALAVVASGARADEWRAPRPIAAARGAEVTIHRDLASAERMPSARIAVWQRYEWPDEKHESWVTLDALARPTPPTEKDLPTFELSLSLGRIAQDGDDLGPRARAAGAQVTVACEVDAGGLVTKGTAKGAEGPIEKVGVLARSAGSWVVPFVPKTAFRVGTTWDLPLAYWLWSINQPGAAKPEGYVTQIVEAIENHDGALCARIRTVASIQRVQRKGMTPAAMKIGDGEAVARFRGEGTMWVGVDGCLREEFLDVHMRLESVMTKQGMDWRMRRQSHARPASAGAWPTDWSRMTDGRPVAVGYPEGLKEGRLVGQALMCVVVKYGDPDSEGVAYFAFHDPEMKKGWEGYLPVIVDLEHPGEIPNKELLVGGLPGLLFIDTDGTSIFMLLGATDPTILRASMGAPVSRVPAHEPAPEYKAALAHRVALRAALADASVTRAAVTALLAIRKAGIGVALQAEAREAEVQLTITGQRRIDDAVLLALDGKASEAKAALAAVAADFQGLEIGARAKSTTLPAPALRPR